MSALAVAVIKLATSRTTQINKKKKKKKKMMMRDHEDVVLVRMRLLTSIRGGL
jgi:hypothetical protein